MRTGPTRNKTNQLTILKNWDKVVQQCNKCQISCWCRHKVTWFRSAPNPKIVFVGEAPGDVEYGEKEPFIGPAGITLREIIDIAIPDVPYILLNSIFCPPFTDSSILETRAPNKQELLNCAHHLRFIFQKLRIPKVVAVGKVAHRQLNYLKIDHIDILHTSRIMQSGKRQQYETDKAIQQIQTYYF
jgi:uracil-DNA glycosylase family 4